MDLSSSETIGFIGVALLLVAFLLNLLKVLRGENAIYLGLNFLGAGLAGLSSWLIDFLPFVILESVWALVAAAGLLRLIINGRKPEDGRTA